MKIAPRTFGSLALAAVAVLALWAAGSRQPVLLDLRREEGLTQADPLENLPPLVAFSTVALGGFRGLVVDLLWIRSAGLQREGRYFELVQLADWITRLQPRFASIWAFHAWNLAYNVSVMFDEPEDRWRWVQHGLSLLRDRGLAYNPGSPGLYRELAWMYAHKLGADLDRAHDYYKQQWAAQMEAALAAGDHEVFERARLDPARMAELTKEFGPLDWRSPHAHALYWAVTGRSLSRNDAERRLFNRQILQALTGCFLQGRVWKDARRGIYLFTPHPDLLPGIRAEYERALDLDASLGLAYRNFLVDAVMISASFQRLDVARDVYAELARLKPEQAGPDFESFVAKTDQEFAERQTPATAFVAVESAFYRAAFWESVGDEEQAGGYERLARWTWEAYREKHADPEWWERVKLPDLESIRQSARDRALRDRMPGESR